MQVQDKGWVKIHRKFLDWEWFDDHNTFRLFMYCLLKANFKDKKWRGQIIKRGSFITSLEKLSIGTGLSLQNVRTALNNLYLTHELTKHQYTQYTLIDITSYDEYQETNTETNKQLTRDQHTANTQLTTTKERKNVKNVKNIATIPKKIKKTLSYLEKNKEKILEDLREKFPDKNTDFAYEDFIAKNKAKNYKYKNHYQALCNWIRDDNFGNYSKKDDNLIGNGRFTLAIN